jgi:hypothetical protein
LARDDQHEDGAGRTRSVLHQNAPVHLLFDTGAGFIVLFNKATPRSTGPRDDPAEEPRKTAASEEKKVWLGSLRIGTEEFGLKQALLTRNPKPSQLDADGLMSPAALVSPEWQWI